MLSRPILKPQVSQDGEVRVDGILIGKVEQTSFGACLVIKDKDSRRSSERVGGCFVRVDIKALVEAIEKND